MESIVIDGIKYPIITFKTPHQQLHERIIKSDYPEFYSYITINFSNFDNWAEKLYAYYYGLFEPPKCICGNKLKFKSFKIGYAKYCSHKCANKFKIFNPNSIHRGPRQPKIQISCDDINWFPNLKSPRSHLRKEYIKRHNSFLYNFINIKYPQITNWYEKVFLYLNNMDEPPKCPICGKPYRFLDNNHYSNVCQNKECKIIRKELKKQNRIKSYNGFPDLTKLNNTEKRGYNIRVRYPDFYKYLNDKYPNIISWAEKLYLYINNIQEPPKCPVCNKKLKLKSVNRGYYEFCSSTCSNKYQKQKTLETFRKNFKSVNDFIIDWTEDGEWICKCPHEKCNECIEKMFIISSYHYHARKGTYTELCTNLLPISKNNYISSQEDKVSIFLKCLGIEHIRNCKKYIYNENGHFLELDILSKSLQFAIEINGFKIHSLEYKNKDENKHIIKFIKCKEKNTELISIWQDWLDEDVNNFLIDKFAGNDLAKYKKLWFPDLKDNEWPLDLGWPPNYNSNDIKIDSIKKHFCYHGWGKKQYLCSDSGVIELSS